MVQIQLLQIVTIILTKMLLLKQNNGLEKKIPTRLFYTIPNGRQWINQAAVRYIANEVPGMS